GSNVSRLHQLQWLHSCRILYWGDIDTAGLCILSQFRRLFPHTQSVLMDFPTLMANQQWCGNRKVKTGSPPSSLTPLEMAAYEYCASHGIGLEQERIPQDFVDATLSSYRSTSQ